MRENERSCQGSAFYIEQLRLSLEKLPIFRHYDKMD